ncbi:NUDIX domain-containing protein [Streptosporangium sp. NPDC048047]|uniref:NUDIX hydrolase n=1 Tax=Streptosporangium sp. NPDC048047 TaxID=3155748 RepID=UPI0034211FA6
MTESSPRRGAALLDVHRIRLVEIPAPPVPPGERAAMDRAWDEAVRANPSFFDGPVAALTGLAWEGPRSVVLTWARITYRRNALRRVPGATARLPPLFVTIAQPTDDGRLLVGRMSSSTAAPGRWQPPGGSAEPPGDAEPLDLAALARHAVRELAEETGLDTAPDELTLWSVIRSGDGGAGVLFLAPPRPEPLLRERFAAVVASERALGRVPELDRIALVRSPAELAGLGGPRVDYLEPIVRRYAGTTPRRGGDPA